MKPVEVFATVILVYFFLPVLAWFVYWAWKRLRGGREEGEGESDA